MSDELSGVLVKKYIAVECDRDDTFTSASIHKIIITT